MKTIMSIVAIALLQFTANAQHDMAEVLSKYMDVKDALVKSDSKLTASTASELLKTIEATAAFKQKGGLSKAVKKVSGTTDLEAQRAAFADVSELMWEAVKNDGHIHQDIYYQYCPMKKVYWLSEEPAIRNPYYGSAMLTCGNVADKRVQ